MLTHLDLFSGIGGFALAAQWAGFQTVQFVEYDPYCQQVLRKHWPDVPIHGDITTYTVDTLVSQWYDRATNKEALQMAAKRKDYDEAVRLYNRGCSIGHVAAFYNMSRQAMWKILKIRGCQFRQQLRYGKDNHFHRGTKADGYAQNLLEQALEDGVVQRKVRCETCGDVGTFKDGRTKIQAHHPDYNKPLDVMWLCQPCHHKWHKQHKAVPRKEVVPHESFAGGIELLTGGFP